MDSARSTVFLLALLVCFIQVDAGNVCSGGTGFTQCGAPALTPEQIASIDTARVETLRNIMMNLPVVENVTTNGTGPLVVNHPGVNRTLLRPIVNFTQEQLDVYRSKYGNNIRSRADIFTPNPPGRRKRSPSGTEACEGNSVQTTIFALTTDGQVVQFPGIDFWFSIGCYPSTDSVCDHCMEEEICLPVFCYTISPPYEANTFEITAKRCTCFN